MSIKNRFDGIAIEYYGEMIYCSKELNYSEGIPFDTLDPAFDEPVPENKIFLIKQDLTGWGEKGAVVTMKPVGDIDAINIDGKDLKVKDLYDQGLLYSTLEYIFDLYDDDNPF
jgi:hypothetical protein